MGMNLHAHTVIYRPEGLEFQARTPLPNVQLAPRCQATAVSSGA